jgi:Zn-dependent M28 family amino/carboxypeptidase
MKRTILKCFAVGGACLAVITATPRTGASQATEPLDSTRLMAALAFLSSDELQGRETGTEGNARARDFLVGAFGDAGIEPVGDRFEHPFEFSSRSGATFDGVNVIGWVRGTDTPERYVVVSAHFDHVGVRDGEIYNGADDNASGTAALLEVAYALTRVPPKNSVILAAFDAEEVGLRGARAFVEDPVRPVDDIALNVNIDMVARGGGLLWAGGSYHEPALAPILEAVAEGAPVLLRLGHDRPNAPEGSDWTNSSDHGAFHQVGIPFVYFGVEDSPHTHRPSDDFESVDPAIYVANVRTVLAAIRALDAALPLPSVSGRP